MSNETTGTLLSLAEKRRQHLSNMIVALNGLAITLILGIWTFLLKGFIDYSPMLHPTNSALNNGATTQPFAFSYVILAAGLSSVVMALWRWYVQYLSDEISKIYPEIAMYEQTLGMPSNMGVIRYLSSNKEISNIMAKLFKAQRVELVKKLVSS